MSNKEIKRTQLVIINTVLATVIINIGIFFLCSDVIDLSPILIPSPSHPCQFLNYQYEPSNYTMYIKERSCNKKNTKNLTIGNMVREPSIRSIIYPNGTQEYCGCTKHTAQCKELPYYSEKLNKRINTPPCCRHHMITMVKHISHELNRLNVTHFFAYGFVIGWFRYKDIVPYDRDFDLLIDGAFYQSKRMDDFLKDIKDKYGHESRLTEAQRVTQNKVLKLKINVFLSKLNKVSGDIWPYDIINKDKKRIVRLSRYHWSAKDQPYENIFPLQCVLFHGFLMYIPNKVKEYLALQYGKNGYQKEMTCKKVYDTMCVK